MKKVLITGGAGYIGDAAVDWLLNCNLVSSKKSDICQVTVLDNLMYGGAYMRFDDNLKFVRGDIRDELLLNRLIEEHDAVLHLAAIVGDGACAANPAHTIAVNQDATRHIAETCALLNKRMVFASTCSVYGASSEELTEDSPTNPLSLYAGTKLQAESYVRQVPRHFIFRLGTLFGLSGAHARLRCDLVANILTYKAMSGQRLTVYGGEQWRPLLHVRDAGELMALAAVNDNSRYGTYILSRRNYTILELAKIVASACSLPSDIIDVTAMPFEDQRNYRVSSQRRGKFWLTSYGLFDGVAQMAKVMREGRIADVWNIAHHNARFVKEHSSV